MDELQQYIEAFMNECVAKGASVRETVEITNNHLRKLRDGTVEGEVK